MDPRPGIPVSGWDVLGHVDVSTRRRTKSNECARLVVHGVCFFLPSSPRAQNNQFSIQSSPPGARYPETAHKPT